MRILVVGAGATGGFYGGLLARAGRDVTFLVREGRAAQIRERGLQIVTPTGSVTVHPRLVSAGELRTAQHEFDLVVITTKAYQLASATDDLAPALGEKTLLLPVLNGMEHLAALDQRFGAERVLGGLVRIVADLDQAGRVHQMTTLDELSYGERSGERTARILAVDEVLRDAGFDAQLQPDILATMWQKWWILATMGAVCVLARGSTGDAARAPRGPEMITAIIDECTGIAAANGYVPDPRMLAGHRQRMLERDSTLTSSMYRDMIKGAPVEADHILGDLLARANGVRAPLLTAAYVQLKVYEAGRG